MECNSVGSPDTAKAVTHSILDHIAGHAAVTYFTNILIRSGSGLNHD